MQFVTARDLRNKSAELWEQLAKEKELVVTINGKPIAVLSQVADDNLEETLRILRRTRAQQALSSIRATAVERGLDKLTMEDIDKEIKLARRSRKR